MELIIERLMELGAKPNQELDGLDASKFLNCLDERVNEQFQQRFRFTDLFPENGPKLKKSDEKDHEMAYKKDLDTFLAMYPMEINQGSTEITGLYCFYENGRPIYFGNSRQVFTRLRQHFLGQDHNTASLVYLMARTFWERLPEEQRPEWKGERKDLPFFGKYRVEVQKHMIKNWEIAIEPMSNAHERYLAEIYYAMHFKTYWNNFDTH